MTFLLIFPAWIVLMSLVAGLCMAARVGDKELRNELAVAEQGQWEEGGSQPALAIAARPGSLISTPRSARESGRMGVAA